MAKQTGLRSKILKVLQTQDEMYAHEIAQAVGQPVTCVSNALFAMENVYRIKHYHKRHAKCIYSLKPFQGVIEEVIPKREKDKLKRYVPEFKPMVEGAYNLYEGRNLAMLAR